MRYRYLSSPVGMLLLAGDEHGLARISFQRGDRPAKPADDWTLDDDALPDVADQLREYFDGHRRTFEVQLAPRGTEFQLAVWDALLAIPYGETRSYMQLAQTIGRPAAVRAVGAANGANPLPIIVPCHRVIGTNGSLTGFGGGLPAKQWLLSMERGTPTLF